MSYREVMRGGQSKIRSTGARAGEHAAARRHASKGTAKSTAKSTARSTARSAAKSATGGATLRLVGSARGGATRAALLRRFESASEAQCLEDVLLHWIQAGSELLGAIGGAAELRLADDPRRVMRVHAGVDASLAEAVLGVAPVRRASPAHILDPRELLVAPTLECAGITVVLALPLSTDSLGEVGSIRFLLRTAPDDPRTMRALLAALAKRVGRALEARLLTERFRTVSGRLDQILEGAAEAILDVDSADIVVGSNPHAAAIFGLSAHGLRGLPVGCILPDWRSACDGAAERASMRPWREMAGVRADGTVFTAEVVAAPATRLGGWTLFAHDASHRRRRETEGRQSERVASVATLASGLGHDLNNTLLPARAHLNALHRIVDAGGCELARPHLSAIRDGLDYLQQLADALHFLATDSDHGHDAALQGDGTHAATRLCDWWRDAGPLLRGVVAPAGALVAIVPEGLPPLAIRNDALTRVVLNILTNAAESMPRGRDPALARVVLSARQTAPETGAASETAERIVVEIADNGSGMPPEVERRIFDPFFTTKIRGIGSGLGLPIARRLIEAAGGRISVDTQPGKGTIVRIELSAARSLPRHRPSALPAAHTRGEPRSTVIENAENHLVENQEHSNE